MPDSQTDQIPKWLSKLILTCMAGTFITGLGMVASLIVWGNHISAGIVELKTMFVGQVQTQSVVDKAQDARLDTHDREFSAIWPVLRAAKIQTNQQQKQNINLNAVDPEKARLLAKPTITVEELASIERVNSDTVRRWIALGKMPDGIPLVAQKQESGTWIIQNPFRMMHESGTNEASISAGDGL